ncbi:MAG: CrcB family protein [archaeon]
MPDGHPIATFESLALVALGGFAGANARYAAGLVLPSLSATLAVNTVGSLARGFVLYERAYAGEFYEQTRIALDTGFLSSLTTYSTFAVQTAGAAPEPAWALANVLANYALGLTGVLIGRDVARRVPGGRSA